MGLAVVTVASGGLPIVESTVGGTPVTEAANGYGVPVTKVIGKPGMSVVFETIGVGPGVTYATWDVTTAATLSGGNLVATNTGTTSSEQGAKSATGKTSGKYYFEMRFTAYSGSILRTMAGVGTSASTYAGMSANGTSGAIGSVGGVVHANGAGTAIDFVPAGQLPAGGIMGVAVDLDNRRAWFRETPSGNWNGSATANPATNTEGVTIPVGTMVPLCTFGGTAGTAGNITTANFGASAFVGTVPAGFTSGWPADVADTTAPIITSTNTVSNVENTVLAHALTANEAVTWAIVAGGADNARFELSGSTLRWLSNGTKDFEAPNDANVDNAYIVTVRATDTAANPSTTQTITVTVTNVAEGGATIDMNFTAGTISGAAAFTDVLSCARASTGYAQTAAGTLTSFAVNTLRRTDKGLLVEEARTNTLYPSQTFETGWAPSNASITANAVVAPDGTTTADTMTDNGTSGSHTIYTTAVGTGETCVFSLYAKAGTANWIQLYNQDIFANFNLATGLTGNKSAGATSIIEALGNGWYRCSLIGSKTGAYVQIYHTNNTDAGARDFAYAGTGLTFHIWGAQVEVGAYPTSYIPTTSAAVTRAADVVTLTGAANTVFQADTASVVISFDAIPPAAAYPIGASNGGPLIKQANTTLGMWNNSALLAKSGLSNHQTTAAKYGTCWNPSGRSLTAEGLAVVTDAGTAPADWNIVYLGTAGGSNWVDTYIRQLELWNTRISDAALVTETT